jgi:putative hydrolase of the HAD superfamily
MMSLEAVTLDAAGTLIAPVESVGRTYARFAARHGIALAPDDTERSFKEAFAAAPPLAFPGIQATRLADHERAWWRAVVRQAFGPAAEHASFDACFADLFAHYGRPEAWRGFPEVPDTLRLLRERGLRLAVVSNFDGRLLPILGGLGLAPLVDLVVHSSAEAAAKPDPAIFRRALASLGVSAWAALHAGDGLLADVEGARRAGLSAVLVDRGAERRYAPAGTTRIATLAELPAIVSGAV